MVDFILSLTRPHKEVKLLVNIVGLGQLAGDTSSLVFVQSRPFHGMGHFISQL